MEYIHVRSLEKHHPGYKDRVLSWGRIQINMAEGDHEIENLCEIDFARYIKMILLELRAQKPLPNTNEYWTRKGFDLKKRPISLTLQMLQKFIEVVSEETKTACYREEKEKSNIREEKIYVDFEKSTLNLWNSFCDKHPTLSKITSITDSRRKSLKSRFVQATFKDFSSLLLAIEDQPFLLNGNQDSKDHKNWKISFDWLIQNDTNHVKVLERKYRDNKMGQWWRK